MGSGQGGVKGLCNLHWKIWDYEAREELSDENIILKEDNGLGEGRVIMVQGRVDDPFIENGIGEDVD